MATAALDRPSITLLDNAPSGLRRSDPFPYVVFDDVLPPAVYEALARTYPDPTRLDAAARSKNNHRFNLLSGWGAAEFPLEKASPAWRDFISAHESPRFAAQVLKLFPEYCVPDAAEPTVDVDKLGPNLARDLKISPTIPASEIAARATVACNTPVHELSQVRGVHCDARRKAYVGLLYFRSPEDDSEGGDLEIHRWKPGAKRVGWPVKAGEGDTELVETVAYKPNRLVLFMTTHDALHSVSPRGITPHYRRLVVVSGWLPGVDFYDTATNPIGRLDALRTRAMSGLRRAFGITSR